MNMHKLVCVILILYGTYIVPSSPRELTLIQTSSSEKKQINHERSASTSEMFSRLSYYPTPRDSNYNNYQDIDTILVLGGQNGNAADIQNQYSNSSMNSCYMVNIPDERTPKIAKFSKKTVVAFTLLGCLNVCKLVTDILEIEKYYNEPHANNDSPGALYASLGFDITSLICLGAAYQCNHNKF